MSGELQGIKEEPPHIHSMGPNTNWQFLYIHNETHTEQASVQDTHHSRLTIVNLSELASTKRNELQSQTFTVSQAHLTMSSDGSSKPTKSTNESSSGRQLVAYSTST